MNDLFYVVETAIDYVFQKDKYVLNLYEYAKSCKMTKNEMTQFINSSTAAELSDLVMNLMNTSKVVLTVNTNNCVRVMDTYPNHVLEK